MIAAAQRAGENDGANGKDEGQTDDDKERRGRHTETSISGRRRSRLPVYECNYQAGGLADSSFFFLAGVLSKANILGGRKGGPRSA